MLSHEEESAQRLRSDDESIFTQNICGKNSFSFGGFPLSESGSVITRPMQAPIYGSASRELGNSEHAESPLLRWLKTFMPRKQTFSAIAIIDANNRYPYYCSERPQLPETATAAYSVPMMHPPMAGVIIRAFALLTGPFRLVN